MSVINQMLKDLESRRQSGNNGNVLDGVVFQPAGQSRSRMPVIALLLVLLVAVLVWLVYDRYINKPARTSSPTIVPVQPQIDTAAVVAEPAPEPEVVQQQTVQAPPAHQETLSEVQAVSQVVVATEVEPVPVPVPVPEPPAETAVPIPQIFSVSPEPVPGTGKQTEIFVRGDGFSENSLVHVSWRDGSRSKQLGNYQVSVNNEGLLVLRINPGRQTDNWTVRVEDEQGNSSEAYSFQVVAAEQTAAQPAPQNAVVEQPDIADVADSPAVVKRARELRPSERAANIFSKARTQLSRGEVAEAEANLKRALAINPTLHDARKLLAAVMLRERRKSEAAELLDQGLAQAPAQTDFLIIRARIYTEEGNITAAIALLESQKPALSQSADYYALLAALYQRNNRHEAAANLYGNMLKLNPSQPVWSMGLGISLEAMGQNDAARDAYERALQSGLSGEDVRRFVSGRLQALN
jgi:tetratricopeptide (TPR) repeat protein